MICREIINGGTQDVTEIPHVHEQQYFLLLRKLLPLAKIVYEASRFELVEDNGILECTTPDFYIKLPNGKKAIIEITTSLKHELPEREHDPKKNQKKIMRLAAPNIKYVVLYGNNLASLKKRHPEIDFFSAKKIRKEESALENSTRI